MKRNQGPLARYLPLAYFAAAIAVIATLLPTALRPPPSSPPTSAELSPDTPPDDSEVLISELSRGRTVTAGTGKEVLVEAPDLPPVLKALPRKSICFGDPPRTTESMYSAPCVAAWSGDNGGSTWRGVTRDEIRWGILLDGGGYEGPVSGTPRETESGPERTWRVYEDYFNKHFEFYGRRLRLYLLKTGTAQWQEGANSRSRAAAAKADEEFKLMGITEAVPANPAEDEALKRGLMVWGGSHHFLEMYRQWDPYMWSFTMDGSRLTILIAELLCKQLHNKPVSFAGDPTMHGKERKLGVLIYHDLEYQGYEVLLEQELKDRCGWGPTITEQYNVDDNVNQWATVMTKFRAAGVTTVLCGCDPLSPVAFTATADEQGYFPEWVHAGSAAMDRNGTAALYSHRTQWKNSIGITSYEMNGARASGQDGMRAYKSIDPDNEPSGADNDGVMFMPFVSMLQVAGGIQMAGPKLTPHTIKEGLLKRWAPRPPVPYWSIGGGYGPGDWTYSDYVSLIWWDPDAARPGSSTDRGAYRYVYNGKRFRPGELPTAPIPYFKEGITEPPPEEKL